MSVVGESECEMKYTAAFVTVDLPAGHDNAIHFFLITQLRWVLGRTIGKNSTITKLIFYH